ncbi:hypothetical protein BDY24DRAFT_392700 [Mrakia frigida]|uniref:uncharacterized protein n=1 Tax=Mrakia frigida TaxID=29902 RepID=UPI003FCC1E1A
MRMESGVDHLERTVMMSMLVLVLVLVLLLLLNHRLPTKQPSQSSSPPLRPSSPSSFLHRVPESQTRERTLAPLDLLRSKRSRVRKRSRRRRRRRVVVVVGVLCSGRVVVRLSGLFRRDGVVIVVVVASQRRRHGRAREKKLVDGRGWVERSCEVGKRGELRAERERKREALKFEVGVR